MNRDEGGRFRPGQSGNPGGRPAMVMQQTLSGLAGRRLLLELLQSFGPGLTVVVVDARGLVLEDGCARRVGIEAGDVLGELGDVLPDDVRLDEIEAARLRYRREEAAQAALLAEGWRQERDGADLVRFHGPAGEVLGFAAWVALYRGRALDLVGDLVRQAGEASDRNP